jgi:hypothetical protein
VVPSSSRGCQTARQATTTATATTATTAVTTNPTDADATDADDDDDDLERLVPKDGVHCPGCGMLCKELITMPLGPGDYYLMGDAYAHCKACDEPIPELDEL